MDDIQEEMDIADQIGDAIARPADGLFDDDDLLAELAMMEEADMEDQLLSTPAIPQVLVSTLHAVHSTLKTVSY
jgi:Snf7